MDAKPTLKVIGVGLPRTGTASLKRALTILGFNPCQHMQIDVLADNFPYTKGCRWSQVFDTADKDTRQQLMRAIFEEGGFKASIDFPGSLFVKDLMEIYFNVKFVLSVRNSSEAWRKSFNDTLDTAQAPWFLFATYFLPNRQILLHQLAEQ